MLIPKTNPSLAFPPLPHSPLGNSFTPFFAVTNLPSSISNPILSNPSVGKASSEWKIQKSQGISLPYNHHNRHSMLMEINGYYWVPVSHNNLAPKCLTNILLPLPISFTAASNPCSQFQPPNWAFHAFLYQAQNFHYIQNKLK